MCGLAGIARASFSGIPIEALQRMAGAIRHRGPDGYGFFADDHVGLAHVRLSIMDIGGGAQPMTNEDGHIVVVFNGEIYNFRELRQELVRRGHFFRSNSDTEVLVHAWESWGSAMTSRLNGQFAFALYDRSAGTVFLARDRYGVRPLFFAQRGDDLLFCSEAKGLFASRCIDAAPDPKGLDQVFTTWGTRPPRTVFADVSQLPPGSYAVWSNGSLKITTYYALTYDAVDAEPNDAANTLVELLSDSINIRAHADVPVGGYLSGGLDSAIVCSIAARTLRERFRTFSISFSDPQFDEGDRQTEVASTIGTDHVVLRVTQRDIANAWPVVVTHLESPVVRAGPVPMYLLAKLTKENGISAVLSGEGADELFLGYDVFKEAALRRFCSRQPSSTLRPQLFERLYPYLDRGRANQFFAGFFTQPADAKDPLYSHLPRFCLTAWIRNFYSREMQEANAADAHFDDLRASLPPAFPSWAHAHQAAYLEMITLLSPYLLSAQSDRVGMAWAVEARFPFLDHRLFEFASKLPVRSKLRGLRDKDILRRIGERFVPRSICERPKHPYRAPDIAPLFGHSAPDYVRAAVDAGEIGRAGFFRSDAVAALVQRALTRRMLSARENQALIAVLSTQLWQQQFFRNAQSAEPLPLSRADVRLGSVSSTFTHERVAV